SSTVGMPGSASKRVALVTARARNLPVLMYSSDLGITLKAAYTCPLIRSGMYSLRLLDPNPLDAGHPFKQFASKVGRRPDAARGHVDLTRIGFGIGDELGNGFGRE